MTIAHLLDMDGVLILGGQSIAGSIEYVAGLVANGTPFKIFTNNSRLTPEDHAERLRTIGFSVQPEHIYTSALATARFLELQKPGASAFVIGDYGLVHALRSVGCRITEFSPDFVVIGDTISYHYEQIVTGAHLVAQGARFLATNSDGELPERARAPSCLRRGRSPDREDYWPTALFRRQAQCIHDA